MNLSSINDLLIHCFTVDLSDCLWGWISGWLYFTAFAIVVLTIPVVIVCLRRYKGLKQTKNIPVDKKKSGLVREKEKETVKEIIGPWKEKLLRSYKRFVQDTHADTVIDDCFTEGILSSDEKDRLLMYKTPSEKNRHILKLLLHKSEDTYQRFLECLSDTHTKKLILETDITKPLRHEYDENATQVKRQIFCNREEIVKNTLLENITDDFICEGVFEIEDWENITNSSLRTLEKNTMFINKLLKTAGNGFHLLLSTLRELGYHELVTRIETTHVSNDVDKDIEKYLQDEGLAKKIESEEITPGKLMSWKKDDTTFFPTKATECIYNEVRNKQKVIVTGLPGAGKSANVHHITMCLKKEGHRLSNVKGIKEIIDKMNKFEKEEKQVYVIDNVFGVHRVDEDKRKEWIDVTENDLERCLKNGNIKILCTSRMQITADEKLSNIKSHFTIVNISENENKLSSNERTEIFRKHAIAKQRGDLLTEETTGKIRDVECPVGCFPLVCRLLTGDMATNQSIEEYINNPMSVIADRLLKLRTEETLGYFCLLMCLICDNNLPVKTIGVGKEEEEDDEAKKISEELLELCEVPITTPRPMIKNKMHALLQTFVKLECDTYRFVHDIIQDAVIKHLSNLQWNVHKVILKHCSDEFMLERVHLSNTTCEDKVGHSHHIESCINIPSELFPVWSERVLQRICDGISIAHQLDNDVKHRRCSLDDFRRIWQDNPWRHVFVYNPCVHSTDGDSVISQALGNKSPSDVNYVMCTKGYTLHDRYDFPRHTALHWAVFHGLEQTITQTLTLITQTKLQELDSIDNLLCMACCAGCSKNVIEALIDGGSNVNQRDRRDITPLWSSLYKGHYNIAEILLDRGADINQSIFGMSPLHQSVINPDYKKVEFLLNHGADLNIFSRSDDTPLSMSLGRNYDVTELLINRGADINQDDGYGKTSFYKAVEKNNYEAVKLLLDHGADINKCTNSGTSPLYQSIFGQKILTELLQSSGAVWVYKGRQYNDITDIPLNEVDSEFDRWVIYTKFLEGQKDTKL